MAFRIREALRVTLVTVAAGIGPLAGQGPPAQAPAPPPAPQVAVGGVVYGQYGYQLADTAGHQNNFDITRGYVNVIGKFGGGIYTRVTLDLFSVTASAGNNDAGSYDYRLKYAYVAWTPGKSPLTYKLGMIHTPWLDWEEALWDYRMQGQMAMERVGTIAGGAYVTSSDLGFGIDGKVQDDRANFQVSLVNGEGYHGGVGDKRKDLEARLSARLLGTNDNSRVGGLRLTAYGQYGKPTGGGTRNRALVMASYRSKEFTLAAEAAVTRDSVAASTVPLNGHLYSAFGVFHIPKSKAAIIARADILKPQVAVADNQTTRLIAGVSFQVSPNLRALLDWDFLSYQTTPTPAQVATRSQGLLQIQFTF
jgi:hypothetical protein